MLIQSPLKLRCASELEKENNNNNITNDGLHEIGSKRSVFTFIKGEDENIFIREYHYNLDDWSRNP